MTAGGVHASVAHARVSMAGERPVAGSHETTTGNGGVGVGRGHSGHTGMHASPREARCVSADAQIVSILGGGARWARGALLRVRGRVARGAPGRIRPPASPPRTRSPAARTGAPCRPPDMPRTPCRTRAVPMPEARGPRGRPPRAACLDT